jgi:hypothetical protein
MNESLTAKMDSMENKQTVLEELLTNIQSEIKFFKADSL